MRNLLCLNGEWDFMPLYDQPQCRRLPEKILYEARKLQVPSSWRRSYPLPGGKSFGKIPEYDYAPFDLHGYPEEWDAAEAGVLHRMFRVPERMAGQRIVLRLDGIMQKAVIYIDRKEAGVWEDGYLPLRLDITSMVEQGHEHHLHIVCSSFDTVTLAGGMSKITGLMGSWYGRISRGIWQDVYLEGYPRLSLEDVTIRTSVRKGRLEVQALAAGPDTGAVRGPLTVRLSVWEKGVLRQASEPGGKEEHGGQELLKAEKEHRAQGSLGTSDINEVLEAPVGPKFAFEQEGTGGKDTPVLHSGPVLSAECTAVPALPPAAHKLRLCENARDGEGYGASFNLDWSCARLWSPDEPFLYTAVLELVEDGEVVDRRREDFGFREFWCEGPQFMLNGIPVNLRGDSWHFQGGLQMTEDYIRGWYRICRSAGINTIRLHAEPYPADYLRIADEEGMLIVDETAIYGSGKSMLADHPAYVENCRQHVRRLVQRDKNHPSVILWSLQNEMRWVDGRDGFKQYMPGLMADIRELDPTRAIIAEGDNRLLSKAHTEVESRHYNIDGTISQWDRSVPLTFGEHGGWWYICPQNSSMYTGLQAYRGTDESTAGLAEKERLFVEYARRQGVSGISTFNFAHYFMRAMPEQNILLPSAGAGEPGVKPKLIPAYSLTINNGMLPEEYPLYSPNPAFAIMAEAFKPATIIAAEYNACFYDHKPVTRSFDVYNDTYAEQEVTAEFVIRQHGKSVHEQRFSFRQKPAEHKVVSFTWMPGPASGGEQAELTALLFHGGRQVHELRLEYRMVSGDLLNQPVNIRRKTVYLGADRDFGYISRLVPGCERTERSGLSGLSAGCLLIVGSYTEDKDGTLEALLKAFTARGGRLLLLEQHSLSLGKLPLSRRPFLRAYAGSYRHPVLEGLGDRDFMFWHEELHEEGPEPIIHAAFEKPVTGDFSLLLECSAGDFGDGGDLWSPLLEYRSGTGLFLASQLELMANLEQVPQACLLLRNLLAYAGGSTAAGAKALPVAALVRPGGQAAAFLGKLRLRYTALDAAAPFAEGAPGGAAHLRLQDFGLIVAEACVLEQPGAADALRRHAEAGGQLLLLPAEEQQQAVLARLLDRPVRVVPHEAYHLAADYGHAAVQGFSPVDLFGFDKVFLSPREVQNHVLGMHSLDIPDAGILCTSVEGTAWKDYFVHGYTAEYSRLALVELNRNNARPAGVFMAEAKLGAGSVICSQLLPVPDSDKAVRLYSRLLSNLGASFDDGLLSSVKGDGEWAVETMMALPCPPHADYSEMKAYYIDPEFSLNNLGEGLYGWMQKKERRAADGTLRIANAGNDPWFLSCFVHVPEEPDTAGQHRPGRLRLNTAVSCEIYLNGARVVNPEQELILNTGLNRLIAIAHGTGGDLTLGLAFLNPDGTYMKDLEYRLTLDEVEPK
ncbi:glycoside hydrolase family 2 [Paenibacillus sp. PK3_47]|uniref:glycoside hydrolase family 2 protein n=1 Tax=Paenibacillus sp. PK3_47 TaxID=2072642 RepID=UPI00201DACB9|nr:glycoside hydrolase family 2 TIM barrel-domain containing protein [Paenibacillus sp. PK3_47]UQZ33050.1 glycoside hydrolase family 2 [Paenibacillus sp. PK3_47]